MGEGLWEVTTGASMNKHGSKQTVCTPPELIAAVEGRFGLLEWDLACDSENCVGRNGGFKHDLGDDALLGGWSNFGLCWLNPPFGQIGKFAEIAALEQCYGARIITLVPASVSTNWYRDHVHGKAYCIPIKRVRFVGHAQDFPKDMMLVVYWGGISGWGEPWDWRAKK